MRALLAAALLSGAVAPVTQAQTQPATNPVPADIDPARLSAARLLIEQIMPREQTDKMMDSVTQSIAATMRQAFSQNAMMESLREQDPKAAAAIDGMIERQQRKSIQLVKASMPAMKEAMARAYARRFTLPQMADLTAFFATPSGQAYLLQAPTIMSDPDVSAWLSGLMRDAMARIPDEIAKVTAELEAIVKKDGQ